MLTTQDLLNICLAVGFLILVGVISFTLIQLILFLKAVKMAAEEVKFAARSLSIFPNEMKIGALSFLRNLLSRRGRR